jgi:hypothetical protein
VEKEGRMLSDLRGEKQIYKNKIKSGKNPKD